MGRLQKRFSTAGLHGPAPVAAYLIGEIVLAIVGLMIPLYIMGWRRGMVFAVLAAVVGYMIPSFVLGYYVAKRQKEIRNGLPDALDLLIVCLEAGLGLDQAISKCADELALAHPALAEELRMINVEGRAGKPRIEAFKNFADRTKVDDVRALVSMLVQTDRFGTSVAQALRTHADVSRTKRRQRAEERAAKIGVKLVFPLVFCLFPAFYVVTLGPAIIKFVEAMSPGGALSGGN
jgi:tight adherence protein C